MRRTPALLVLGLCLAVSVSTSGCLRDDVFPEPFAWHAGVAYEGRGETVRTFDVPAGAQRLRFEYRADLPNEVPSLLGGAAQTQLRIRDEQGRLHMYNMTRDGATRDTFGGGVAGGWALSITDPQGQSGYEVRVEWFAPKYGDWQWWQVWR